MIIDAHLHIGAWDHPGFLGRRCDVADAIAVLDANGIDGAVMAPTDRGDNPGLLAEMQAARQGGFAGPLWFFAWARPEPEGRADLDFVAGHRGAVAGLKLHPSLARRRITDPAFGPALELAAAHDLVVLCHCGRWQEMASYRFAIEAARAHPTVRFVLAHAGGDTPPLAVAAADLVAETGVDNVWFEISGLREYWVIERNVAVIGAERYLLGSDYGLAHPAMYLAAVRAMAIGERAQQQILGDNAMAVLGPSLG